MTTSEEQEPLDQFVRQYVRGLLIKNLFFMFVVATIWSLLSLLPEGWWHLVINLGSLAVLVFWSWSIVLLLTQLRVKWSSVVASGIFVAMLILRSVILAVMESF